MKQLLFTIIGVLILRSAQSQGSRGKSVVATMDARWPDTPILSEASEYMNEESKQLFWKFINRVANSDPAELQKMTDREIYDYMIKNAQDFLTAARIDLLKFSLAMRMHSPQVEAFRQIAINTVGHLDCDAAIDVHGRATCKLEDLDKLLADAKERPSSEAYKLDHHYPGSQYAEKRVILYAEIGTSSFQQWHNLLKTKARNREIDYIFRHYVKKPANRSVRLTGYGVELAIKSTEYKAQDDSKVKANVTGDAIVEEEETDLNGFNFRLLKQLHPDFVQNLDDFKMHLLAADELTPLKVWQLQDLNFQAAQRVMSVPKAEAIQTLQDVAQNFPIMAHSLTRTVVKSELRKEVESNQEKFEEVGLSAGESALFINGLSVDLDVVDIFSLLDLLKKEERLSAGFFQMGYRREFLTIVTALDFSTDPSNYAIDFRPAFPEFINDLDKDKKYREWGNSVKMLVQPYFPGMIRPIGRNFFNLIFFVDPSKFEGRNLLKVAYSFWAHDVPIRLGIVFVVNPDKTVTGKDDAGVAILNLFNFVKSDKEAAKALRFISDMSDDLEQREITAADVIQYFKKKYPDEDETLVFGADTDYDKGRQGGAEFMQKSGLTGLPKVLLNGVPLEDSGITADRFEETVVNEIMRQTPKLQRDIIEGKLDDSKNVMDYIMDRQDVMPRLNLRLLNDKDAFYLDMTDVMEYHPKNSYEFGKLRERQKIAHFVSTLKYLKKNDDLSTRPVTVWIVADLETAEGRELYYNAIKHLKHSANMRIGLIHNPTDPEKSAGSETIIAKKVEVALRSLTPIYAKNFVTKLVKEEFFNGLRSKATKLEDLEVHGMNMDAYKKELSLANDDFLKIHSNFVQSVLELAPGQMAIVANGRVIGPFGPKEILLTEDFDLLEKHMLATHAKVIQEQLDKWDIDKELDKYELVKGAQIIFAIKGVNTLRP